VFLDGSVKAISSTQSCSIRSLTSILLKSHYV
jgi:hypothetical protein